MKIAIFHNYFDAVGGGEKLVIAIARALHADIITTNITPAVLHALSAHDLHFISLGTTIKIPGLKQLHASFLFARANYAHHYDFFILSGEWAVFAAKKHHPHLYYCHTPARVFYDLYDTFLQRQSFLKKPFFQAWVFFHKYFLERAIRNVQKIVCNSQTTKQRIKHYLHRDATILYPFSIFSPQKHVKFDNFWLSVNRFYPEKRIELQLEAFRLLPGERLVIVGGFAQGDHAEAYYQKLIHTLPSNVTILQNLPENDLAALYQHCKGLIATAHDEDFGMTLLEAFSFGKPAVAVNEGGYRETMIHQNTGFLTPPTPAALAEAIRNVARNPRRFQNACRKRAATFRKELFFQRLRKALDQKDYNTQKRDFLP